MSAETFFSHRKHLWLWINSVLVIASIAAYIAYDPIGGRNGGTVVGYALGGIGAAGIFYLLWYGIRKRSYHSSGSTLKGTLAAHVWLGVALAVIVPLHAGFQFGWNVHTLAYVLMVVVIVSGVWGAIYYVQLAPLIQSHRGGGTVKNMVEQIHMVTAEMETLAGQRSDDFLKLLEKVDVKFVARYWKLVCGKRVGVLEPQLLAPALGALPESEKKDGLTLVQLADKKRDLIARLQDELRTMMRLRAWLLIHLPVSLALLVVLLIHIFVVFYYR